MSYRVENRYISINKHDFEYKPKQVPNQVYILKLNTFYKSILWKRF